MKKENNLTILTAIKPTGELTLGNYLGAIKNFLNLQNKFKEATFYLFIADLHATTINIDKNELRENIKKIVAFYIASGIDLNRTNIFIQSDVLEHANLGFILESTSYIGELERMIQFKEKSKLETKGQGIRSSLLTYPALMAADILLYDTDIVPIGEDQKQHLELTINLANRFNKLYGNTFKIPKLYYSENSRKIMGLQNPDKKMSKSINNQKDYILLSDSPETITKKIKSAKTDSDTQIYFDKEKKPAISNLLNIYASLKNISIEDTVKFFKTKSYKDLKEELITVLNELLSDLQNKFEKIIDSKKMYDILEMGRKNASNKACEVLKRAKKNMGLGL